MNSREFALHGTISNIYLLIIHYEQQIFSLKGVSDGMEKETNGTQKQQLRY